MDAEELTKFRAAMAEAGQSVDDLPDEVVEKMAEYQWWQVGQAMRRLGAVIAEEVHWPWWEKQLLKLEKLLTRDAK